MNDKAKLLLKGALELSSTEREELVKAIRDYNGLRTILEQRNYAEVFNKSLGPLMGAKCSVCGK